jgi:hypothetical protein
VAQSGARHLTPAKDRPALTDPWSRKNGPPECPINDASHLGRPKGPPRLHHLRAFTLLRASRPRGPSPFSSRSSWRALGSPAHGVGYERSVAQSEPRPSTRAKDRRALTAPVTIANPAERDPWSAVKLNLVLAFYAAFFIPPLRSLLTSYAVPSRQMANRSLPASARAPPPRSGSHAWLRCGPPTPAAVPSRAASPGPGCTRPPPPAANACGCCPVS